MTGDHMAVQCSGGRILDPMNCLGGLSRLGPRAAIIAGLGLMLPLVGTAHAQQPTQAQDGLAAKPNALQQRQQELDSLRKQQSKSAETEAAIKREIEEIGTDRRKLAQSLIDAAARSRELEAKVAATEQRLQPLDSREAAIRRSLESRRAVVAEVLAALQRVGHQQPPALIASPEDALKAVRTAMMLGAVLPEMQQRVQALASDLNELFSVRKKIAAEHDRLRVEMASLDDEHERLTALVAERQKQQAEREKALDAERAKARELADKADNLEDLIAKLERDLAPENRGTRAQIKPGPALAALHDPGRMTPAVAFAALRGKIPIPVNGIKIKGYGAPDGVGGSEKGVSIATRAGAQVTAPADGWVVYAGPFRSYGQLLILDAGGGYHILLAGMARISVDLGQFVLAGEPVAVMGNSSQLATFLAAGSSQPVLYVEFRKDGNPVDPGPWWAAGEDEKVRG